MKTTKHRAETQSQNSLPQGNVKTRAQEVLQASVEQKAATLTTHATLAAPAQYEHLSDPHEATWVEKLVMVYSSIRDHFADDEDHAQQTARSEETRPLSPTQEARSPLSQSQMASLTSPILFFGIYITPKNAAPESTYECVGEW